MNWPAIEHTALVVIAAFSAYAAYQSRETHILVNSRMTEMIKLVKKASKDEGLLQGRSGNGKSAKGKH